MCKENIGPQYRALLGRGGGLRNTVVKDKSFIKANNFVLSSLILPRFCQ